MRLQIEKDLSLPDLNERKVVAAVISLMERTYIRIGNAEYEKLNGSHGLTTLHDKHVNIEGTGMVFSFKGKKGIYHNITLKHKKLARIVQQCRDIPSKELFQYYDANGQRKPIDSGIVNQYIKEHTGDAFTAKDFRTWAGCGNLLQAFKNIGLYENQHQCRHNINLALDEVSNKLGNTRSVCKKYYVHPGLIRLYEEKKIVTYLQQFDKIEQNDNKASLTCAEKVLMSLLTLLS